MILNRTQMCTPPIAISATHATMNHPLAADTADLAPAKSCLSSLALALPRITDATAMAMTNNTGSTHTTGNANPTKNTTSGTSAIRHPLKHPPVVHPYFFTS